MWINIYRKRIDFFEAAEVFVFPLVSDLLAPFYLLDFFLVGELNFFAREDSLLHHFFAHIMRFVSTFDVDIHESKCISDDIFFDEGVEGSIGRE